MEKIGTLFRDHPDLIVGFDLFLPLGYGMDAAAEGPLTHVVLIAPAGVATYQYYQSILDEWSFYPMYRGGRRADSLAVLKFSSILITNPDTPVE